MQKRNDSKEKQFEELVIDVKSVVKVNKGGRQRRYSATVVIGDRKGKVGLGIGKANEVPDAIKKALQDANKNIITIPLIDGRTVAHEAIGRAGAARVIIKPAAAGTGVIANECVKVNEDCRRSCCTSRKNSRGDIRIMKLHELEKNIGATHAKKRVGRGSGSGLGKTSGRGQKGQKARSGGSINPVFEGGQLPLYRRIPKRGFKNAKFRTVYATINVEDLNVFEDGTVVTPALLKDTGLLKQLDGVKVLGNGKLEKKITIQASKFSASALEKIKEAGSKAEVI